MGVSELGIDEAVPFEESGIYVILSAIGVQNDRFHWGIYAAVDGGQIYHATNETPDFTWKMEAKSRDKVNKSRSMRLAMKIGSVKSKAQADKADAVLRAVPIAKYGEYIAKYNQKFTCRIWVREALEALNEAKIVEFTCDTEDIQDEALSTVSDMMKKGVKGLTESDLTI